MSNIDKNAILHEMLSLSLSTQNIHSTIMSSAHNSFDAVYLTEQIREIERQVLSLPNPPPLMERAGYAAAKITRERLLKNATNQRILVLAGPGNNGGDAFVAARDLADWGHEVTVVFIGDTNRLPNDAKSALQAWLSMGGEISQIIPNKSTWDAIIDGIFGIGLKQSPARTIEGTYRQWIDTVNTMKCPVLSLDIPSGLGSDDGCIYGAAIHATITVTFIGVKPGLFTNSGSDFCGEIVLATLNIDAGYLPAPSSWLLNPSFIKSLLPSPRVANSHKGSYGSVAIIGGSTGMVGATLLAGRAALNLGAGRVYIGMLAKKSPVVDYLQPELMLRAPTELLALESLSCILAGPGMGTSPLAVNLLKQALNIPLPLVLDADALNLVAQHTDLAEKLMDRDAPTILTPHPTEAARLLNSTTTAVQNNRMQAALQLAKQFKCTVVLKGAGSICCLTNGKRYINTSGNAGLSTAGTGDVLTGMIGALIAQGIDAERALLLAVYLHGAAADEFCKEINGPVGMTASDVINAARKLFNRLIETLHDLNE